MSAEVPAPTLARLDASERRALVDVARGSIEHGLRRGAPLPVEVARFAEILRDPGASFVTIELAGRLRGCTGCLEAHQPLVADVAHNAWRSAFADPRFTPLTQDEWPGLELHISVLTPPEPLPVTSEADLLAKLRAGIDGLVLRDGPSAATFLPSVWESLRDPAAFLAELKRKAGLPRDHWSPSLRFERYRVEAFS